ncbi:NAD(P)-binding protein [Lojkania enalia]|uniref:NAD(P)-binding protein n=1 Tax=Lojkania enalia TaxID=147567 RepID=A0A9P4MY05_9PLEO|nr:NAD(P)-binding protein [Didymosphaeria enalia]
MHALVTGGSRGIGLAIAHLLARHKYNVTLISRSESSLRAALHELRPSRPPPQSQPSGSSPVAATLTAERTNLHHAIMGDVSSPSFWFPETLNPELRKATNNGSYNVLVNCAGIKQNSLFIRTPEPSLQKIIETNLTGMMLGTRYLLKEKWIRARKANSSDPDNHTPVIINVASLLGMKGGRGAVAYSASKAGVLGFTRALAGELGSNGVRVNAIVPGYIETDMTAGTSSYKSHIQVSHIYSPSIAKPILYTDLSRSSNLRASIPLKRFGRPEEVADAVLFLIRNNYAHNCVLNIDGGLSAT